MKDDAQSNEDVVSTLSGSILILKPGGGSRSTVAAAPVCEPYDVGEVRARLEKKMRALGLLQQDDARAAAGWTRFEGHWIPPGWVRPDSGESSGD